MISLTKDRKKYIFYKVEYMRVVAMKKVKKILKRLKYVDKTKSRYFSVMTFICAFILFAGTTYSYFSFSRYINSSTISIANLNYVLSSSTSGYANSSITVGAGETKFLDLDLKSLNGSKTRYALNYVEVPGIEVYYSETTGRNVQGLIGPTGSIISMRVVIKNTTSNSKVVTFNIAGGYVQNSLTSNITEGYFEDNLTIRTYLYDENFENAVYAPSFPAKTEYSFYRAECSNGVTPTWNNSSWTLTRNPSSNKTSCDVYFKKASSEFEIYYLITGSNDTRVVNSNKPDNTGLYKYVSSSCSPGTEYTFDETIWEFEISDYTPNALCVANFETDKILENADRFIITFDPNGGTMVNSTKVVLNGGTYGTFPEAKLDGYRVEGWYTEREGGEKIESTTPVSGPTTLYAHWEEIPKYTVTFMNGSSVYTTRTVQAGATISSFPTLSKSGYTFKGWSKTTTGSTITSLVVTGNTTLYAKWEQSVMPLATAIINKANSSSVKSYSSGKKGEAFVFSQPATDFTSATTEYRYIGGSPNNYVRFNDDDWRIIGVFDVDNGSGVIEQRVKIVSAYLSRNLAWDTNGGKIWENSSLYSVLNNDYYNSASSYMGNGLTATARSQIANAKWYTAGCLNGADVSGPDFYKCERGTKSTSTGKGSVVQKVGLINASDYIYTYANGVNSTCYNTSNKCSTIYSGGSPQSGWLWIEGFYWLITPEGTDTSNTIFYVSSTFANPSYQGIVQPFTSSYTYNAVRPAVYLKAGIRTTGGDGSSSNPYILE